MLDSIFKVYDIRGKVESELILNNVYPLAKAMAYYFKQQCPTLTTVAVAYDGRIHSPIIKDEVIRAFADSNINVINIGLGPSPLLYYALEVLDVQAGIMITASHNPAEYNGFKMVLNKRPVFDAAIRTIQQYYKEHKEIVATRQGTVTEHPMVDEYVEMLAEKFLPLVGSEISAILDCGNGAAGAVIPKLKERMRWNNVELLYADVDGTYPHHEADPSNIENMRDLMCLQSNSKRVGVAFDGDGDRMGAVTENGTHLIGDSLTTLFCAHIQLQQPEKITMVADVTFSSTLLEYLNKKNITCVLSKVGNAYIKDAMRETGALFGGELSCHFCFADRYYGYDDGIYACMRLFEMMHDSGKTLEELYSILPERTCSPAIRIPYNPAQRVSIFEQITAHFTDLPHTALSSVDGIRAQMDKGWGLIRPSNTEPVLSLRCEAQNAAELSRIKLEFYKALESHIDPSVLKEKLEI